jgi:hypothetical protein
MEKISSNLYLETAASQVIQLSVPDCPALKTVFAGKPEFILFSGKKVPELTGEIDGTIKPPEIRISCTGAGNPACFSCPFLQH